MECHCFPRDRTGRRSSGQWGKGPGRRTRRTSESSDGGTGTWTTANRPSRVCSLLAVAACPEGHYWHGRSPGSIAACFYPTATQWNAGAPTAAYQDVTSSYQNLGPNSRGADYVHNTRKPCA